MNSQTNIAVLSQEQEDFLAFEREFEKSVTDLAKALAVSAAASKDAADISNKGTLKMVWGSLNGDNDKELAQMTGRLATSLNVTQTVLQMVMKISHRKNGFLKQFHEVLVNKIAHLTKDTKTLDRNQREATVVILEEIKSQVSGQLAQHDLVDAHQMRLESIDRYIDAADLQAFKLEERLALFSSNLGDLQQLEESLATRVDMQEARADTLDAFTKTLRQDVDVATTSLHTLGEQARELIQLEASLATRVDMQEAHADALDAFAKTLRQDVDVATTSLHALGEQARELIQLEASLATRVDAQAARADTLDAFTKTLRQDVDGAATAVHALGEQTREIIQSVSVLRSEVSHGQHRLSEQERISGKTGQSINALKSVTAQHAEQFEAFSAAAADQRALHDEHRAITDQQLRQIEALGQTMEAMRGQLASQEERIAHLEGVISRSHAVTRIVLRYAPALVALGLAGAALLRTGSMLAN